MVCLDRCTRANRDSLPSGSFKCDETCLRIFQEELTVAGSLWLTQVYSPGSLMFIGSKKYILSYCFPVKGLAMNFSTLCGEEQRDSQETKINRMHTVTSQVVRHSTISWHPSMLVRAFGSEVSPSTIKARRRTRVSVVEWHAMPVRFWAPVLAGGRVHGTKNGGTGKASTQRDSILTSTFPALSSRSRLDTTRSALPWGICTMGCERDTSNVGPQRRRRYEMTENK